MNRIAQPAEVPASSYREEKGKQLMKKLTPLKQRKLDDLARSRAVKGWAFGNLPAEAEVAIREFLGGGPCPKYYQTVYALCRTQLGLPAELPAAESEPEPATPLQVDERVVILSPADTARLRAWLASPDGPFRSGRVGFDSVENGGIMVRMQPNQHREVASE
jgi:hypothetical protein